MLAEEEGDNEEDARKFRSFLFFISSRFRMGFVV